MDRGVGRHNHNRFLVLSDDYKEQGIEIMNAVEKEPSDDFLTPASSLSMENEGARFDAKPLFDCFDLEWNCYQLRETLPCTANLGGACEADAPIVDVLDAVFPSANPERWNAFHLQSPTQAIRVRRSTTSALQLLADGVAVDDEMPEGPRADSLVDPPYIIQSHIRNGEYPLLYEVLTVSKANLFAQAVDPLVFLHGTEHLRVVRLDQKIAREVISNRIGFTASRVAPGDLIWVYRLRISMSFARKAAEFGLDLRFFPSKEYLEGVKSGNNPKTVFQVEEFAHVFPHTPTVCRLARVRPFSGGTERTQMKEFTTQHVIIEGEIRTGRIDRATFNSLRRATAAYVFRVFFRPQRPSLPHFSAPPRGKNATIDIADVIRSDRDNISLMPARIGIMRSEAAPRLIETIVDWKTGEIEYEPELGKDAWVDAVEVVKLGESGLRQEEIRRLNKGMNKLTLIVIRRAKTVAIASIEVPMSKGRDPTYGWTEKGRRVSVRRSQRDDWTHGTVMNSDLDETILTVWLCFEPSTIGDFEEAESVDVKLACSVHTPLTDRWLGRPLDIPSGSNGEIVMSTVYCAFRDGTNENYLLPFMSERLESFENFPSPPIPLSCWTKEVEEIFAWGPSVNLPIINIDAGAGTGKTTAIAAAIEHTLAVRGEGIYPLQTLIIATAVTKTAIAALVDKILARESNMIKMTRLPGKDESPADLLQQIIDCADDESASDALQAAGKDLRSLVKVLQLLHELQADERKMDAPSLDRNRSVLNKIEKNKDAATQEFFSHRRPNVLALTLDTLIVLMSGKNPVRDYVETAERIFVWMDDASLAPELSIAAISEMLPRAFQRYVGDNTQLPPRHHRHYNDDPIDAQLAGSVAAMLARSMRTPTLRVRHCHRMHPALTRMVSSLFYGTSLVCSLTEEDRSLDESIRIPDRNFPLCVITTGGQEQYAKIGTSLCNESQEQLAISLVSRLLTPIYGQNVAILSCYKEPVVRIKRAAPDLNVMTVDSSMGLEFEVVVVLTTRSKAKGKLDFITDSRRVNVALTRARRAIFVIGEDRVLRDAMSWNYVYNVALKNGNVMSAKDAMNTLQKIVK